MATRSTIAIERTDGTVAQVYCHWDGYLRGNGAILHESWRDPDELEQLIALGDLSSLGEDIDNCVFYGRDCGETLVDASTFTDFEDYCNNAQHAELNYILRCDGFWEVRELYKSNEFVLLSEALIQAHKQSELTD
jgi:hypothetical protein